MPSNLNDGDVIALVNDLESDSGMMEMREDMRRRENEHAMTDVPWLPDHLTRGITAVLPSVEPAYLAAVIGADMSSYITTTTVVPGNPDLQSKADAVEPRYAMERAELFTNRVRARIRWSQFIRGYGVYKLNCGDPATKHPWSLSTPDPLGCFFPLSGQMRPPIMGRKYDELRRNIEYGAAFRDVRQKRRPKMVGDNWDWESISLDVNTNDAQFQSGNTKAATEKVSMVEIDLGDHTYCVALNRDGKAGQVVWERKNLTGGTAYMIVPGHLTDSRQPREAILPYLWAPMNVSNQITLVDTIRMTRSLNAKPQVLVDRNPELLKAATELGIARPVGAAETIIEGDTVVELDGRPYFWVTPDDKDLEALEDRLEVRLARYSSTQLSLTTGEVVQNVTVRGLQLALGARQRQQGPMLTFEDEAEAEILRMWRHSITCEGGYGADDWGMFAKSAEMYSKGETKRGEFAKVNKKMLDFDHDIDVTTASLTREEKALAVDAWSVRKAARLSTYREGLTAAGYPNLEEQEEQLAEEEGYEMAGMLAGPNIASRIFEARMRERAGIFIQGIGGMPVPGAPALPAPNGNNFDVPATEGAEGGALQSEAGGQA